MIFKCSNCGGNIVYDAVRKQMRCPHCDSVDSQHKVTGEQSSLHNCINCGAPIEVSDYTSAAPCEHCGCYLIFDERVEGQYRPHLMIPFGVSKEKAKEIMRERFKKKAFTPSNFLEDNMLEKMTGIYVPFFLYDINVRCDYHAEGTKRRTWTSGNTEYTETSYYDVTRDMYVDFDKIPVDASIAMDDSIMDLMEPYNYGALEGFKEEYMSGFCGEMYNSDGDSLRPRAKKKAVDNAETMLRESLAGYNSLRVIHKNTYTQDNATNYTLMPVWHYKYSYGGKSYDYYINGQTGKAVGRTPVSKAKLLGYGATVWGMLAILMAAVKMLMDIGF